MSITSLTLYEVSDMRPMNSLTLYIELDIRFVGEFIDTITLDMRPVNSVKLFIIIQDI